MNEFKLNQQIIIKSYLIEITSLTIIEHKVTKVTPQTTTVKNKVILNENIRIDGILIKILRQHQLEGLKFIYNSLINNSGCLLSDQMGLGIKYFYSY